MSDAAAAAVFRFIAVAITCSFTVALASLVGGFVDAAFNGAVMYAPEAAYGFVLIIVLTFPFVVGGGLFLGVPIHLLLKRYRLRGLWIYLSAGILAGIAEAILVAVIVTTKLVPSVVLGSVAGAAAAGLWWRLQVRPSANA